jgi:hypothetical protein
VGELGNKSKEIQELDPRAKNLGAYLINGGPGRPPNLKNKANQFKETLIDVFNNEPDREEALRRSLFEVRDGVKYINPEFLRVIISILPKDLLEELGGTTVNFNLAVAQFGKLTLDELKSLAALARTEAHTVETSSESSSDS